MDIDDETSETSLEVGSDELLSADNLRLPESASILVRVHAVRAWLTRRYADTSIEIGKAALALQKLAQTFQEAPHVRRRERQQQEAKLAQIQQVLTETQQRLSAYEEAQALLEECIDHTSGDRVLVEYYLLLEDLVQSATAMSAQSPREQALADVQHRLEHVGAPNEEV
ncbi:MAG: hypothetical protein NVS4B7_19560 [Ktedonobacteraceae bacterium]